MEPTTLLKRRAAMKRAPLPKCHGGAGTLDWTELLNGSEHADQHVRFIHDDILPPGVSIGEHRHSEEEHYLVLSGRGTMVLDGQRHPIGPGDLAVVFPGGSHGLENTGSEDLRILVVAAR